MKRIVLMLSILLVLIVSVFLIIKNKKKEVVLDPIDEIMSTYKTYEFHDIKTNSKENVFEIKKENVNYDKTSENLKITLSDDQLINVKLIDDIIHVIYNDIDYRYDNLGEVDRIMEYKSCNCDKPCTKVIALTEEGELYYIDLNEDLNNLSDNKVFKKIETTHKFSNIGYINDLKIPDSCGINGLVGITTDNTEIIFDNNFKEFKQDYYDYISNGTNILYIYPDGTVKVNNITDLDIKIMEVFISNDLYYAIDIDGYLYEINDDGDLKKVRNEKVSKIGYRTKDGLIDSAIVIYKDASAKKYSLNTDVKPIN